MFGFGEKKKMEKIVAQWLAHPGAFGTMPRSVHYRRKHRVALPPYGEITIHLINYAMPDGTVGRAFYNPVTWTFRGSDVNAIDDTDLLIAYAGWLFLTTALQNGTATEVFISSGEEAAFLAAKREAGFEQTQITARYRLGNRELFEYESAYHCSVIKGAGNTETDVMFTSCDARACLPPIYFVLGKDLLSF